MARKPARKARSTRSNSRRAPARPARRTAVRRSARPSRARSSVKRAKPQTIKIVLEQTGPTLARPDISEDQLRSSKIQKDKRRGQL